VLVCPQCGQEELGKSTQCRRCGAALPFKTELDMPALPKAALSTCGNCGTRLPPLASQCPVCGRSSRPMSDELPTEIADPDPERERLALDTDIDDASATEVEESKFVAEKVPTTETRVPPLRRSTTAQIQAVFADPSAAVPTETRDPVPDQRPPSGGTDLLEQHMDEEELVETVGRARTPAAEEIFGAQLPRRSMTADPFALPELSKPIEAYGPPERSALEEPPTASPPTPPAAPAATVPAIPAATVPASRVVRDESRIPRLSDESTEPTPTLEPEPSPAAGPKPGDPLAARMADLAAPLGPTPPLRLGHLDATLPQSRRPSMEDAVRVEEALSRATAAERLDEASRAVESSVDRSRPRFQAIHAGAKAPESSESQGVRAVLEPPLAPGRKQQAEASYDEPTTVYPVLASREATSPAAPPAAPPAVPPAVPIKSPTPLSTAVKTEGVKLPIKPAEDSAASPAADQPGEQTCSCGAQLAAESKFCGRCGRPQAQPATRLMPVHTGKVPTQAGGTEAAHAQLVLVRGSGRAGQTWTLTEHVASAGRLVGTLLFSTDPYVSPLHATFYFRDQRLYVRDERSRNGVYVRLQRPEEVRDGDRVSIGRQLLLLGSDGGWQQQVFAPKDDRETKLLASPSGTESIVLVRLFNSGSAEVFIRHQRVVSLGRSGCDINFPEDDFLSQRHARVLQSGSYTVVEDLGSANGTFLGVRHDQQLESGDEVMIGSQVLRVELP